MIQTEFAMPVGCDFKRVERAVERLCRRRGLLMALKGSLSQYPGSIQWHFKRSFIAKRDSRNHAISNEVPFVV